MHFRVHPSPRLVCSGRLEGCVLSCLDCPPTHAIPTVCIRGSSISVQGPTLRAVPVASASLRRSLRQPLFLSENARSHSQLDDWLILAQSRDQLCKHRDMVLCHLSLLGLRVNWEKSKLSPVQRIFSRYGVGLGKPVASGTSCAGPPRRAATWQARADPYGQHYDHCVHQPPGWSTIPPHVATRPPSPSLESEASEVALGHLYPWCAQSCSRRALTTTCTSGRVATPSPGGPADLGSLQSRTGRPVCLSRLCPLPAVLFPD